MKSTLDHNRDLAARAREEAVSCGLPQVRLRHLRSAAQFDEIVAGIEAVAEAKIRNDDAKRAGTQLAS
jgi:hypothetical protein